MDMRMAAVEGPLYHDSFDADMNKKSIVSKFGPAAPSILAQGPRIRLAPLADALEIAVQPENSLHCKLQLMAAASGDMSSQKGQQQQHVFALSSMWAIKRSTLP